MFYLKLKSLHNVLFTLLKNLFFHYIIHTHIMYVVHTICLGAIYFTVLTWARVVYLIHSIHTRSIRATGPNVEGAAVYQATTSASIITNMCPLVIGQKPM